MIREVDYRGSTISFDDEYFELLQSNVSTYPRLRYAGEGVGVIPQPIGLTDYTSLFQNTSARILDISGWDTSAVTCFNSMFLGNDNLEEIIGIEDIDVSAGVDFDCMFVACPKLRALDLEKWNMSNAKILSGFVCECESLQHLAVSSWDVSNVETLERFANGCFSLETLDVANWDVSKVMNAVDFVASCSNLRNLDVSDWNLTALIMEDPMKLKGFIANCPNIEKQNFRSWGLADFELAQLRVSSEDMGTMFIF